MPLSVDNIIQSDSGFFVGTSGSASLPAATTPGNSVILVVSQTGGLVDPAGFTLVKKQAISTPPSGIYIKSNVGAESSWTIAPSSSNICCWTVMEVAGLDPDDPVDSTPAGAVSAGTGATLSTGTTPVSATFDGLIVAFHSCQDLTTPSPGTWSGHTNGLTEIEEVGGFDATRSIGLSMSVVVPALSLAAWESTATKTATVGQNSLSTIVVFTAAGAKRAANVKVCTGFEFGTSAGLATGNLGLGIFDALAGSPAIVTTSPRTGTYCLELSASAAVENVSWATNGALSGAAVGQQVARFSVYFPTSLPAGNTVIYSAEPATAADNVVIRYISASQKIGVKVGTGTEVESDATVSANQWISIDMRINGKTTTHRCDWRVTYTDGGTPVEQVQATATGTVNTGTWAVRLGWTASTTATVRYDDVVVADKGGHYPLGNFELHPMLVDPAGTLTIPGATTDFNTFTANGTMAAWNATTARNNIDELPPVVGASADGFAQVVAATSNYVEIPMATVDAASLGGATRGIRMLACGWAASTTAATIGFRAHDGVSEMTLSTATDKNFDNTTTPAWVCRMVVGTTRQDWTQAKVDALAFRVGFSSDATPNIGIHTIMAELALRIGELYEVTYIDPGFYVHYRQDPDSNGIIAMIVTTPAGTRGATLEWSILGTPQAPVYVNPNTVHEQTIGATDVATITSMTLSPDPE